MNNETHSEIDMFELAASILHIFDALPDGGRLELYDAIAHYMILSEEPKFTDPVILAMFLMIKKHIAPGERER